MLPFPWGQWSDVVNLPPGNWAPQGTVLYRALSVGLCCWQVGHPAVAQARYALGNGGLCCWALAIPPSLLPRSLCSWMGWSATGADGERGWLISTEWVSQSILLLKSSCWGHPWVCIHMGHKYHHSLPIQICPHTSFPDFLVTNYVPFQSLTIQPNCCPWPKWEYNCISRHCFFQEKWAARHTASSSACWEDFFYRCHSGMPQKRAIVLKCPLLGGAYVSCRTICKAELFSLSVNWSQELPLRS